MMKVILVDDEPIALEVLKLMLSKFKEIEILGSYTDPLEALEDIYKTKPEIVFLDIDMGRMGGLELASAFLDNMENVEIVFVTAYSQYAVDAFELNAIDYLQKPIQESRMKKTIERLRSKVKSSTSTESEALRLQCFGDLQILDGCDRPLTWRTQKAKELFVYLWYKNEPVSKILIMDDIFPDKNSEKAAALLHTTVYQLRKSLEKLGYSKGIEYANDSYNLNVQIKSDFSELKEILEKKLHTEENISRVLEIYEGEFLEKEDYFWAAELRQECAWKVFDILEGYVIDQLQQEEFPPIINACLEKLYKMDSYNERIAQMKIIYYGKKGKRTELEKFYKTFEDTLSEDMDLLPMDSTTMLYKKYIKSS